MAGSLPRMSAAQRELLSRFVRDVTESTTPEWRVVERRIGSPGTPTRWSRFSTERNERYGEGNWEVGFEWEGRFVPEEEAVETFYYTSYRIFLSRNPDLVDSLCTLALELTDSSAKLRGDPFLEVRAIEKALDNLGRKLEGDDILDLGIQSGLSDALNPDRVPFLGGARGKTLEQFWFGESRCLAVLR